MRIIIQRFTSQDSESDEKNSHCELLTWRCTSGLYTKSTSQRIKPLSYSTNMSATREQGASSDFTTSSLNPMFLTV